MRKTTFEAPSALSLIFNIIRSEGLINRTALVRKTGLSKSTVSLQINKLIEKGLIREVQPEGAENNVRKLQIELVPDAGYVVGVFLGIYKLSITLFNIKMEAIREMYYDLESAIDPAVINPLIIEKIEEILKMEKVATADLWGIGLGFPFPVDFQQGIPETPPNLPLWHQYPLKQIYEEHFSCPVLIDNDVNVMALGEGYSGIAQDEKDFLFVKVGNGIGAGLFLDGRIYRGDKGSAGDIGHIAIDGESRLCHCGNQGCLETIAAAPAIARKGLEVAMTGESPLLSEIYRKNNRVTAQDVGDSAQRGDMYALQIIRESGRNIGSVLAKLVNFMNPRMVIIGGGVAGAGNIFLASIRESILSRSTHLATIDLQVRFAELKEKCGPYGAGRLIIEEIFSSARFSQTINDYL